MKHLLYAHAKLTPFIVASTRVLTQWLGRRVLTQLSYILPGPRGRQIALMIVWLLGLLLQAVMVWLLGELITLCIGLYELWAILAGRFVAQPG